MPESLQRPRPQATPLLLAGALSLLVALAAVAFALRLHAVFTQGDLAATTGLESQPIFAIWRLHHGYPLYTDPWTFPYTVTMYNFGFYHAYAAVLQWLGMVDARSVLAGRLLTLALAAAAVLVSLGIVRQLVGRRIGAGWLVVVPLVLFPWIGRDLDWWTLTVRPDVGASLLAMIGLSLALRRRPWADAIASLCFAAAWSFKQSQVFIALCAIGCVLLIDRRLLRAFLLGLPLLATIIFSLLLGGPNYRANVLTVPALPAFDAYSMVRSAAPSFGWDAPGLLLPILLILALTASGHRKTVFDRPLLVVFIAFLVTLAFGYLSNGRAGSSRNMLIDPLWLGSVIAAVVLVRSEARIVSPLAIGCVLIAIAGQVYVLSPRGLQHRRLMDDDTELAAVAQRNLIATLPKPVFTRNEILTQPWIAGDNTYPAFVPEHVIERYGVERGVVARNSVDQLVARGWFAAMWIDDDESVLTRPPRGYREAAIEQPALRGRGHLYLPIDRD